LIKLTLIAKYDFLCQHWRET